MYLLNEIEAHDATLYLDETQNMWSNRIQVLKRKQDLHPSLQQDHVTYLPYNHHPRYAYLYNNLKHQKKGQHIGQNNHMTIPSVDVLRLTKRMLERDFDFAKLTQYGILHHHFCLHADNNSNEQESEILNKLKSSWGSFYAPSSYLALRFPYGAPWKAVLTCLSDQPLEDIRRYFGEEIAMCTSILN